MSYTVHQAKTNLSRLIKEAESGKEVIITRGKEPVAKLIPVAERKTKRVPGRLRDLISWQPYAFAPLTDDELRDWGV
jgi:prevent-host-death family protein